MSKNAVIPMEWFFDVLNKRLGPPYNLNIADLFLCVPHDEECEFDFEIPNVFKFTKNGIVAQGNSLEHDYPNIANLVKNSNTKITIKVFFLRRDRFFDGTKDRGPLILWHKKYPYPKVSAIKGHLILTETEVKREIHRKNVINQLKAKYN